MECVGYFHSVGTELRGVVAALEVEAALCGVGLHLE
jgi:hypothetical protein